MAWLLLLCLSAAAELGHRDAYLLVKADNMAAVSLYASLGFEAVLEDAAEAAQWNILERAAEDARAAARAARGATLAAESSWGARWVGVVTARAQAVAAHPECFFTEVVVGVPISSVRLLTIVCMLTSQNTVFVCWYVHS